MLFARRCPLCCATGLAPCAPCARRFEPTSGELVIPGAASAAAVYIYEGALRDLILGLKYANRRDAVGFLADRLATTLDPTHAYELITWIPTTAERRRRRGFDQAELLARALARRRGLAVRRTLVRTGRPQTGRSRGERVDGPRFSSCSDAHRGRRLLLIDDVITSGATAAAAIAALSPAGPAALHLRLLAVTPRRSAAA